MKEGDRVVLIEMGGYDPDPVLPGTEGTVAWIGDEAIGVRWDDGRRLNLLPGDKYRLFLPPIRQLQDYEGE